MKNKMLMTVAASLAAIGFATAAQATTLTFDNLNRTYGDGLPLGANMTGNGQYLAYAENGYVLTLNTINLATETYGAHIGDGTSTAQTYNWHDLADNNTGAYVTLTKADGGLFDLTSFAFIARAGLTVTAGTYAPLVFGNTTTETAATTNFRGVSSVRFAGTGTNQLDNVQVSAAVPEPATWAMMLAGFGAVGFAMRRRKVSTAVKFA